MGIDTPEGSYTYHYEDKYFSLFNCEELECGKHWDGHTEKDVTRLLSLPSTQQEQRWIPCSERLPDVAQRVLLSGHGQVMVGMLHSFGKYSLEPTGISYVYLKDDIEAWMPLPEQYKAERRTDE